MVQKLSVIILTYNEELNLEQCLKSIAGLASEIFVVDSGSTDKTQEIAKHYGAEFIIHRDYKNQAQQFNWALDNLKIKGDWILKLDADEYLTPELKEEIEQVISGNQFENQRASVHAVNGYYIKRRVYFMGRWMRHGGYYPVWFLRLWRRGGAEIENKKMDEHAFLTKGEAGRLKNDFIDDNKKGLSDWIRKHNDYASREAEDVIAGVYAAGGKKTAYYKLPSFFRALGFYIYRYFFRLGFLDGKEGLIFHVLQCFWYRFLIDAKIWELNREKAVNRK